MLSIGGEICFYIEEMITIFDVKYCSSILQAFFFLTLKHEATGWSRSEYLNGFKGKCKSVMHCWSTVDNFFIAYKSIKNDRSKYFPFLFQDYYANENSDSISVKHFIPFRVKMATEAPW